jgi:hypothetical protein
MDELVVRMVTDSIKILHAKILHFIAKGVIAEYRHQLAADLADTLLKLKDLAETATARALGKIHVDEKKEVKRIRKLRHAVTPKTTPT